MKCRKYKVRVRTRKSEPGRKRKMLKGIIFNIQKFSIHDGPGIRTTVFLKGCPLNCRWCANPESKSAEEEILYTQKTCLHCSSCVAACPAGGLHFDENGMLKFSKDLCTHCMSCVAACPSHALTVEGEEYTVEQVVEEAMKDQPFYEKSGGGVTLSGGEPLLQKEFALALLKALKKEGIHTTIETTAYTEPEYFKEVLPYIDLLYTDVKHPDDAMHQKMTDVSNERILKNIRYAIEQGKELVARVPVIPRFNHSVEVAEKYAVLFQDLGVKNVHLLPFHQMGQGKWEALGLDYLYENDKNMKKEEVFEMRDVLEKAGLNVQVGG